MSKKMPSGVNFFKTLIKDEIEEIMPLNMEEMPKHEDSKPIEIDISVNNRKIEDVVKLMDQAAHATIADSESLGGSVPDVAPIRPEANLPVIINTSSEQVKKKKPARSIEDKNKVANTSIQPANINKSNTSPFKKRSIYLTDEQYLQIRIRAAQDECDYSLIVRKAVDAYFNNNK